MPQRPDWVLQGVAALAAFSVYFCMYAFRKPFTAAMLEGEIVFGLGLKSVLVLSQLAGYMLSKFIGIKVVSEMPRHRRAFAMISLVAIAELALVGYAFAPVAIKPLMLFFNGLPLGMIFGIVLAYLEGRRFTEAMTAILCASFIASSGVVKSVGTWLMIECGVNPYHMPYVVGMMFSLPLLISVAILDRTPPPDEEDVRRRSRRDAMSSGQRWDFFRTYAPGLSLLIVTYVALTIVRTVRDDYAVEIWADLAPEQASSVFARSETAVAIVVTFLAGLAIAIRDNLTALISTLWMMIVSFVLVTVAIVAQSRGALSPFVFMVLCGIGLYVPYVAFHTTVFERLIASSRRIANLGFLMYLADAIGYLGYAAILVPQTFYPRKDQFLSLFRNLTLVASGVSVLALLVCVAYFRRALRPDDAQCEPVEAPSASGIAGSPHATVRPLLEES